MRNINLMELTELVDLGLAENDAQKLVTRRTERPFANLADLVEMDLSEEAHSLLTRLVESGNIEVRDPSLHGFHISFSPEPKLTDIKVIVVIEYSSHAGEAKTLERRVIPSETFEIEETGVSFSSPIRVMVHSEAGETIKEEQYDPEEIMDRRDGPTFFARLSLDLHPIVLPSIRRFRRSGRFVVPSKPQQRFDGYSLAVSPVGRSATRRIRGLLQGDPVENDPIEGDPVGTAALVTAAVRLDAQSSEAAQELAGFTLSQAGFEFDGSFNIDQHLRPVSEPVGWVWFLAGPSLFFGFQADPDLATERRDITILLPVFDLPEVESGDVPMDAGEQSVLNRPDIFADDPGLTCKPFDNPGRILGERRFSTVLRVTDPEIGVGPVSRRKISREHKIPWEGDPKDFQAMSLARGHILDMRMRYRSNGYSLGDVAHSMTLAPRQTRRIVKVDFERRERTARDEVTVASDEVAQATLRDRTYADAVQANLKEWSKGGSKSSTTAGAGGIGFSLGPVSIGGGAAHSSSRSSSWQKGGRSVSASEEQNLRDAVRQYGDSLRSIESTVVTEVEQSETVEGVSEVVRNINYCHALSTVYYQILRHLRIDTELAGVSECVFVPLEIKDFTDERILRHRELLRLVVRDRRQRSALKHIEHAPDFEVDEIPDTKRKDQPLTTLRGSINIRLGITRPTEGEIADEVDEGAGLEKSQTKRFKKLVKKYERLAAFTPVSPTEIVQNLLNITETERDRYFQRSVAPHIARVFVDKMRLSWSKNGTTTTIESVDFTLAGRYRYGRVVRVDFQVRDPSGLTRDKTESLVVEAPEAEDIILPERSFADVTGGRIEVSTAFYNRRLSAQGSGRDDLISPGTGEPEPGGAMLTFPISLYEERNEREEIRAAHKELLTTLNRDLYYYHKIIWWRMDRDELYSLLDGFHTRDAFDELHSIAGIVDRRPIGILGNTLVFRVSPGIVLDSDLKTPENLLSFYSDGSRREPFRVSLPTSGLYARAHMDSCNACERHAGTTDWVLDNPEPELADLPASLLQSRRAKPMQTTPTAFPETIINLQNAPDAPEPMGLDRVIGAVTTSDSFRDMAGLAGTQENVRAGLQSATNLASGFGNMAHQQAMAKIEADASAAKDIAAVAAANKAAVDMGMSTKEKAQENTEAFSERRSKSAGRERGKQTDERARKILEGEGGGTQVTVGEDGAQVVHKDPEPKREPDPQARHSVVAIPPNQVLFINFETGSDELRIEHIRALEILVGDLGLKLDKVVQIEGHASKSGSDADNLDLASRRANKLWSKLHALMNPLEPSPNFTPQFLESAGEEGSYRARFSGVDEIANARGRNHRNDPVEKAVLFTFDPSIDDVRVEPKVVNFFGVEITISGHFIFIGNTIIASTPTEGIKIVNRSTNVVEKTNVTNETITENNKQYNVQAEEDAIVIGDVGDGATVNITVNRENGRTEEVNVKTGAEAKKRTEWRLQFSGPMLEESSERTLMDVIDELTTIISNLSSSPANAPGILANILTGLADATGTDPVDVVLHELDIMDIKPLLDKVRFGNVMLKAEFKADEDPDIKSEGNLAGSGIIIGTEKKAPAAVVLNNARYTTSKALAASKWDDQENLREFAYVSNSIGSQAMAIARALLLVIEMLPVLPGNTITGPVKKLMGHLKSTIEKLEAGSQVYFKAFDDDAPLEAQEPTAMPTGAEMQLVVMASGMISFDDQ